MLKPIATSQEPDKQWMNIGTLSARLFTGGNQSPPPPPHTHTHTQTPLSPPPPPRQMQCGHPDAFPRMPPRLSPYLHQTVNQKDSKDHPQSAQANPGPPTQHTGKKTRMRGPDLLQYKKNTMLKVSRMIFNIWVHGHELIKYIPYDE